MKMQLQISKNRLIYAPDDKKVNVLGRTYIAYVYSNQTENAKEVAAELKRVKATSFLNIPAKKYVYDQYIPFQTKAQVRKASQLMEDKKYQEALDILKGSLKIYDSHVAKRLIGDIFLEQHDLDNALSYYNKVYDEFKFDPLFLHRMALIYLGKKDMANARKCIQEIKHIDPNYEGLKLLNLMAPGSN